MHVLIDTRVIVDFQSAAPIPQLGAIEALGRLRRDGHSVIAVNVVSDCAGWLQTHAGFFQRDLFHCAPARHDGDLLIASDPTELLAWKARCPFGQAILWHAPNTRYVEDDPAWFRAWDWEIVRWFSQRAFRLAAAV